MHKRGETVPTPPNAPTIELDEEFWKYAELLMPGERPKTSLHLRVDHDVAEWFKKQGKGHLTRMNVVLRAYYLANRKKKAS
ncbi:MAG: BrnA antitoxin family protein [Xanthobacteraceae bacterium]